MLCVSPSTILRGLGLEGKLTADQIAKKWDNLRTKYKVSFWRGSELKVAFVCVVACWFKAAPLQSGG